MGDRLTQQDRRQIAEGLSEGLGYAEIARRLGRPTSTVSREVLRNGGQQDYRADRAQQAARQRARRRRTPTPQARRAPTAGHGRDPGAVRAFEERITQTLVQTGLPRMMARVLTCLSTTDTGTLTAKELSERLQVSPASISTAISYLEEQELVRRERDTRRRRDRYVVDEWIWYRSFLASAQRNAMLAETALDGARIFGPATPVGLRMETVARFLQHTNEDMLQAAERWRHLFTRPPS
ncbi:helix-turn-helix domain-containing protein [Nonomuraea antimicrobica]|uniref:Helix-turn-helix domain-containing protein n=1 Tax=Nonomuraea antimicrobica TaxID=561173 RepID=A0ABP7C6R5_9ACTN